jgi:tetratricopeptide (TPR) repeat protein
MTELKPKQLVLAENVMYEGKLEEALKIVNRFENNEEILPKDKLSSCILKGRIYYYKFQFSEAAKVGEIAYKISKNQNKDYESIDALLLKSLSYGSGEFDEALGFALEGEKLINSNITIPQSELSRQKAELFLGKALIYFYKSEVAKALKNALSSLALQEGEGKRLFISRALMLIAYIYANLGDLEKSQDFAKKCLEITQELGDKHGNAMTFTLMGEIEYLKGNFDQALNYCKHGYSLNVVSNIKPLAMWFMGALYKERGQLNQALKYHEEANKIAEEIDDIPLVMMHTSAIGKIYRMKGDYEKASEILASNLELSEKIKYPTTIMSSLFDLVLLFIDKNSRDLAQQYLNRLKKVADQTESKLFNQEYTLAKAVLLKTSGLSRNRVKAEKLLRQIIEEDIIEINWYVLSLVVLCDYLLEELYTSNDVEILNEINQLITRLLHLAERQNSYSWLAEAKLLQAKLALIRLKMEKARKLMTEAQRIADLHGLNLLAMMISSEHDILLEKFGEWDKFKKEDAPMADRMELASFDGVINRLQGKSAIMPPELVGEEPILLLIMDKSGATYFNHPFMANWDHSDLFSSFMSAFNTFMDEIFSKSIDRIRVGENTILINPVDHFLTCYVIKGQSYPALQKLTRFTEAIRQNSEIWQALNKSVKTSEMLELDNPPALKTVIYEIF